MKCLIRHWKIEDAKSLSKLLNNRHILDNLRDGIPFPYTEDDAKEYIQSVITSDFNQTFAFAIVVNKQVVGSIGVFRCKNIHQRTAELGYYIGEAYWGMGIATSAIKQICDFIFHHTNILRIFAEPFAYNQASCRVLEKEGFQCEGTLRKNAVKNGKILDMKMYSLIKDE